MLECRCVIGLAGWCLTHLPCSSAFICPCVAKMTNCAVCRQGKREVDVRQPSLPCCQACFSKYAPTSNSVANHCACVNGAPIIINEVLCYLSNKLRDNVSVSSLVDYLVLWDGISNNDLTTAAAVILNLIPTYEVSLEETGNNFPERSTKSGVRTTSYQTCVCCYFS